MPVYASLCQNLIEILKNSGNVLQRALNCFRKNNINKNFMIDSLNNLNY